MKKKFNFTKSYNNFIILFIINNQILNTLLTKYILIQKNNIHSKIHKIY